MERLTPDNLKTVWYDTWELCGLDSICERDCRKPEPCKIPKIIYLLGQYEDTGLTPEEIADHEEMFKAYRSVCGGKSPEEIGALFAERDALKKALKTAIHRGAPQSSEDNVKSIMAFLIKEAQEQEENHEKQRKEN